MPKVYLAGPEVFLDNAIEVGAQKKEICSANGLVGLFPLDKEIGAQELPPPEIAQAIYKANVELMSQADALIANVTPFRGPSMDVGTAFEIGFCASRGIPVFGYSNTTALLRQRIHSRKMKRTLGHEVLVDAEGMEIENFGFFENLMIEVPMRARGGIVTGDVRMGEMFTGLSVFEQAVQRVSKLFNASGDRSHRASIR